MEILEDKQIDLENIDRLELELDSARNDFRKKYGCPKTEHRILTLLEKKRNGLSKSQISQLVRSFSIMSDEEQEVMLNNLVSEDKIEAKNIPSQSGRGRKKTSYLIKN